MLCHVLFKGLYCKRHVRVEFEVQPLLVSAAIAVLVRAGPISPLHPVMMEFARYQRKCDAPVYGHISRFQFAKCGIEGLESLSSLHSAKGGAVETGCSDLYGVIY